MRAKRCPQMFTFALVTNLLATPLIADPLKKPTSDAMLIPEMDAYFERLSADPPTDDKRRAEAMAELATWIRHRIATDGSASIVVVCTGNSRRSVLAAALGNAAALRERLNVRFYSGGTVPSAVNPRALRALTEVGFLIDLTDRKAEPGPGGEPNPVYEIRWTTDRVASGKVFEFSKLYSDPANPKSGFASIMVCDEANDACPTVAGADIRVSLPFDDPKALDGQPDEEAAYRRARDEIGRAIITILKNANRG